MEMLFVNRAHLWGGSVVICVRVYVFTQGLVDFDGDQVMGTLFVDRGPMQSCLYVRIVSACWR